MNQPQGSHVDLASCSVLDHVEALVRIWTPADGVLFVNRGWCEFTGTSAEDNIGDGWLRCVCDEDRASLTAALAAGAPAAEYRLRRGDGQAAPVADAASSWTTNGGAPGFVHTVTPRAAPAPEADRARTMSKWAHELRGPLNAILGWSDLLSAGDSAPDVVQRGLKAIANNARQQALIIKRMTE